MPIVITPSPPTDKLTPTQAIAWTSDFIGPIEVGSNWQFTLSADSENNRRAVSALIPADSHSVDGYQVFATKQANYGFVAIPNGSQAFVNVFLLDPRGIVVDSGQRAMTWDAISGLPMQIAYDRSQDSTSGGLTPQQALQLEQVHESTVVDQVVNAITLTEIGSGPSEGPLNAFLPDLVFGVIVRIASVPAELVPNTPDGDYWFPSLAVVRVFRGSDLWLRVPIHTSNKLVSFWQENLVVGLSAVTGTEWLLNLSVQVTFREGVTGQAFLMHFP